MKTKEDLRIIKTKTNLYNTLISLMKNKTFEEIKVADICSKALVNRSTFYAHYNDKYDLLVDLINDIKSKLLEALDKNEHIVNTKEYYIKMIELILDHIENEKITFYSILKSNQNSVIVDILIDVAVKDINKRIEIGNINKGNIPTDIFVSFYLGAVSGVVIEWLKTNNKYTKERIIKYLDELIPNNV